MKLARGNRHRLATLDGAEERAVGGVECCGRRGLVRDVVHRRGAHLVKVRVKV
jgi:hypothetical protein